MFSRELWEERRALIDKTAHEYLKCKGVFANLDVTYGQKIVNILIGGDNTFLGQVYYDYRFDALIPTTEEDGEKGIDIEFAYDEEHDAEILRDDSSGEKNDGKWAVKSPDYKNEEFYGFRNTVTAKPSLLVDINDLQGIVQERLRSYKPEEGTFFASLCFVLIKKQEYFKEKCRSELKHYSFDEEQKNGVDKRNRKAITDFVNKIMAAPFTGVSEYAEETINRCTDVGIRKMLTKSIEAESNPNSYQKVYGKIDAPWPYILWNLNDSDLTLIDERIMVVGKKKKLYGLEKLNGLKSAMAREFSAKYPGRLYDETDDNEVEADGIEEGVYRDGDGFGINDNTGRDKALRAVYLERMPGIMARLRVYYHEGIVGESRKIIYEWMTKYLLALCLTCRPEPDGEEMDLGGLAANYPKYNKHAFFLPLADACLGVLILMRHERIRYKVDGKYELIKYLDHVSVDEIRKTKRLPEVLQYNDAAWESLMAYNDKSAQKASGIQNHLSDYVRYEENVGVDRPCAALDTYGLDVVSDIKYKDLFHKLSSANMLAKGRLFKDKDIAELTGSEAYTVSRRIGKEEKSLRKYLESLQDLSFEH